MKSLGLSISGMGCQGCADRIAGLLAAETGVTNATVSFERKSADVTFDPDVVAEARLRESVTDAGYGVQ